MVQAGQTSPCYDADFYPFGGERDINSSCAQNYKFEGKERDAETNNDDFGARYYSSRLGRWLSADWSAAPAPVPYANLTNPQTLNLYAMVSDNPESFADLDGHCVPLGLGSCGQAPEMPHQHANDPFDGNGAQESEEGLEEESIIYQYAQEEQKEKAQNTSQTQTQTQPKQLSAEDVSKAIQSAKQDTGPNAKKAVDFLNSLGTNWNLSGDILRQALKDSKVDAHGVDKNVDSVARSGDKVTVQLNKGLNFLEIYKTKTTISFDVGDVKGRPALLNIQGVEVFHGYHYVPKTDYGPN
jgi:RHS repeat-associated protein